jgi:hypothetical protein
MVLGGLDNTSTLRVFTWEDSDASAFVRTVPVSSITNSYTETAPDGTDWYAVSFPGNISGATYRSGRYLFAFDGGVNAPGRPRAYVRLESVTPSSILGIPFLFASEEYDVWNPDYAFGSAALGTQGSEIGIGLAVGGGTIGYPQFAVGYKDDFVVYTVTATNATQISRFGDYFSVRPIPGSARFAAETYDVLQNVAGKTCAEAGCRAVARYVEFGRPVPGGPRGPRVAQLQSALARSTTRSIKAALASWRKWACRKGSLSRARRVAWRKRHRALAPLVGRNCRSARARRR